MNIQNLIAAFKANHITIRDLPYALRSYAGDLIFESKHGFMPDITIAVAGVSMRSQATLVSCEELLGKTRFLPAKLESEPDNAYDPNAIKVLLPQTYSLGKYGDWKQVGYIPRGLCLNCGAAVTAAGLKKGACLKCSSTHIDEDFNKKIYKRLEEQELTVITEWIGTRKAGENIGVRIAIGTKDD